MSFGQRSCNEYLPNVGGELWNPLQEDLTPTKLREDAIIENDEISRLAN